MSYIPIRFISLSINFHISPNGGACSVAMALLNVSLCTKIPPKPPLSFSSTKPLFLSLSRSSLKSQVMQPINALFFFLSYPNSLTYHSHLFNRLLLASICQKIWLKQACLLPFLLLSSLLIPHSHLRQNWNCLNGFLNC